MAAAVLTLAARAGAQNFDYYVFALAWTPEFCHEHASNSSDECRGSARFVAHGLWASNRDDSDPQGCPAKPFDASAVPEAARAVMPEDLYRHEWERHGVCSGMSESAYFEKIAALYRQFAIPIRDTGQDQSISATALRRELSRANPGWMPSAFSIHDRNNHLTEVRVCMSRSFEPVSCPHHGDTRNTPITVRARR